MSNEIKVSVIMPSYNVADYIRECLDSVINQKLNDIEIICVDAGSTDGTLEILEEYEKKDSRIKLVSSDKKSYGHQMNMGLSLAGGKYVGIVETDDFIDLNMYKDLYNQSENSSVDIVKSNFYHLTGEKKSEYKTRKDASKQNLPKSQFTIYENANILNGHPSIWAAIYRNDFLTKNNIRFMEAPGGGWVDNPFYFETFILAKSIKYTEQAYYYYRESNPNSSSNNIKDLTLPMRRMLNNISVMEKYHCNNEDVLVALYVRIFWHIRDIMDKMEYSNSKEKIDYYITRIIEKMDEKIIKNRFNQDDQKLYYSIKNNMKESELDMPKISIIMPIYNAEDGLKTSIDSVLKQTLDGIELICIDDGSTDNSLKILRDYANKYDFIKVYSQENQGSGKARNNAMEVADGEYIGFLDADDYFLDEDTLERLYDTAKSNNAKMVSGNILHDVDEPGNFVPFRPMEYYQEDKVILPEEYGMPWSFYKCLFKTEFLAKNEIVFPDLLRGQDPVFLAEILTKVDKVYCVATDCYAYVYYDAINRCNTYRKLYDQLLHYKIVLDYLSEPRFENSYKEFKKAFYWFVAHLTDENIITSIKILREIFEDDMIMLKDLETYYNMTFNDKKDVIKELSVEKPELSIIVPVRNAEKIIKDVFIKLKTQTFENIEVIFIDYGSKDKTLSYLEKLVKDDFRFRIIDKNITELNKALKIGYDEALSEYLFFLKPENKLSGKNAMEHLMEHSLIHDNIKIFDEKQLTEYYHEYVIVRNIGRYGPGIYKDIKKNLSKNPKISVIIPVYNAEDFLDESITSLLNQSFKQIELVCVNDGSKDNSLAMLNDFAQKDPRVIVIDQENGGCGAARNKALKHAKGEYIYFFDPDDYILPNTFERLYKNAVINETDLVMFKIARFRDGEPIDYSIPGFDFENVFKNVDFDHFSFTYKDIKRYVLNASFAPWTKLYRKALLDRYDDFEFPTNIAFDDAPFHVYSLLRAESISFIPEFFYHYRLSNPNSIINTSSNGIDIFRICDIVENFLIDNGFMEEFKNEYDLFKIRQILNYLLTTNTEEYYQRAKKEFKTIKLSDNHIIDKVALERYEQIKKLDNLNQYLSWFYNKEIDSIKKENNRLRSENTNLKHNPSDSHSKENQKLINENKSLKNRINNYEEITNQLKYEKFLAQQRSGKLNAELKTTKEELRELKEFKKLILESTSWKSTKPLRSIKKIVKK